MSTAKVIEIFAEGKSVENAIENGLADASKTVKNIQGLYVNEIKALIENNTVAGYRVNLKVTFLINN